METDNNTPVFIRIKRWVEDGILDGKYESDKPLPSVRELSGYFKVNTNTIVRTYERLNNEGTVYSIKGVGFFVSPGAKDLVVRRRTEEFNTYTMPQFIKHMKVLGVSINDFINFYNNEEKEESKKPKRE